MSKLAELFSPPSDPLPRLLDAARLSALYQFDLLDKPAEPAFDRITRLAARVLNAPICAVSLVDKHRQFFASAVGYPEPLATCRQSPLSHSLCQYVVGSDAPLRIYDAANDPRFATHNATVEWNIAAYLGVPLRWEDETGKKFVLGAFKVADVVPREWSDNDLLLLQEFAALLETEFQLRGVVQKSVKQTQVVLAAQAAQKQSEARFQGLTEASPMGVFVMDTSGKCVYVNPKLMEISGSRTASDLLGAGFLAQLHPGDRERVLRRWQEAMSKRQDFSSVHRLARPDRTGRDVWVSTKSAPLRSGYDNRNPRGTGSVSVKGEFMGWAGTVEDISERKAAEDALAETFRFVHQITETVPLIMTVTDLGHEQNVYANQEFTKVLGYSSEEITDAVAETAMGEDANTEIAFLRSKMHADDLPKYMEHRQKIMQQSAGGPSLVCEYRMKHASGRWCWFRSRDTVFERDRATGLPTQLLSIAEDITAAKNHEERLLALTQQLQRSNAALQEFASVASHDLQEPLRKVQAFGDRLKSRCAPALGTDGTDYLDRMLAAAARMQALIDDLLRYSRVSSKAQEFRPTDLNEIVRGVLQDLETRIQQTGGKVAVEPLPRIEADPMQMRQLFQNLIGNALKFHKPGQPPEVTVSAQILSGHDVPKSDTIGEQTGDVCRLSVKDNGIGFEEQYAERVFNVFERLNSRTQYEGTGMGLAICRKIVQRHGGTIFADSSPDQGTLFLVTLPVTHSTQHAAPRSVDTTRPLVINAPELVRFPIESAKGEPRAL